MRHRFRLLPVLLGVLFAVLVSGGGSAWGAVAGDTDGSKEVELRDVILGLQLCAGISPDADVYKKYEVNGDKKIGMEEVIYALQVTAGLKVEATIWYKDEDGDGYSDGTTQIAVNRPSSIYYDDTEVFTSGDLDDTDPDVHPSTDKEWVAFDDANPADEDEGMDVTVPVSSTQEVVIEYSIPGMNTGEMPEDGQIFDVLDIPGCGYTTEVGKPQVPIVRRYVAVPEGARVTPSVLVSNHRILEGFYVFPAQKALADVLGPEDTSDPPFEIDSPAYEINDFYPSETVQLEGPINIRGVSTLIVQINPVQFNPVTNQLKVYSYLKIGLDFQGGRRSFRGRRGVSPSFDAMLGRMLLNNDFLLSQKNVRAASDSGESFLIITHPNFLESANTLKDWKIKKGIQTEIKMFQSGTTAETIKDYIESVYPSYVLLIGDSEFIPTFYKTWHDFNGSECLDYGLPYDCSGFIGTDLYYAILNGDEYSSPDLHIGRLSVDTATEADKRIDDIIDYEKAVVSDTDFYNTAAICAQFQHATGGYAARRFAQTSEDMAVFLSNAAFNGEYDVDRIYNTTSTVTPRYWSTSYWSGPAGTAGGNIPSYLLKPGFAWDGDGADITNSVNAGCFLLTHRDHGAMWPNSSVGYKSLWGTPRYYVKDVQNLNNDSKLPVVWSINCTTGWFDNETDDASTGSASDAIHFSEAWERNPDGGAVGVIAASRTSYSGFNDRLVWGWMDAIWPDFVSDHDNTSFDRPIWEMGAVLNYGKYYMGLMYPQFTNPDYELLRKSEFEMFHWFGDPTMEIWTDVPQNLTVSHVSSLAQGTNSLSVNVNQNEALICISDGDRILSKKTSVSGANTLSWSAPEPDTLYVTVTKHNFRPYEGTVSTYTPTISPPANVTATDGTYSDRVRISWSSVSGASHYRVYYNTVNSFATATALDIWQQGLYNEHFVSPGQTYYYWVAAATDGYGANESAPGGPDTGYAGIIISPPTGVSAYDGTNTNLIGVSWSSVSGASYYRVYRSTNNDSANASAVSGWITQTSYNDASAEINPVQTYFYWLRASVDSAGTNASDFSASDTGWKGLKHPSGVQATKGTYTDKVVVSWDSVDGAYYYKVWRNTVNNENTAAEKTGWITGSSFTDTGVVQGTNYYYWIKSRASIDLNAERISDFSTEDYGYAKVVTVPGTLQFSSANYTVNEDTGSVTVTVTRTDGSDGTVSIGYTTGNGSATAGEDYTSASGTLTFSQGVTSRTFTVTILNNDGEPESNETVNLTLSNPGGGATLRSPATAVLTIYDNYTAPPEPGQLQFSSSAYSVSESGGSVTVTVTRTDGSEGTVSAVYIATDGTAESGLDFTATSGTLTFAEGDTSKNFTVSIIDDAVTEGDETFSISLNSPAGGATLGSPTAATVTIADDDGDTIYLQNETVTTTETHTTANTIWAGKEVTTQKPYGDYIIQPGGNVTLNSETIYLEPGFSALEGSTFRATAQ